MHARGAYPCNHILAGRQSRGVVAGWHLLSVKLGWLHVSRCSVSFLCHRSIHPSVSPPKPLLNCFAGSHSLAVLRWGVWELSLIVDIHTEPCVCDLAELGSSMSSLEPGSPPSIYLLHTSNLSQPSFPVPRNRHPPNPRLLNCLHGSLRVSRERTLLRLAPTLTHCSPKPDCPRLSGSSSFQHFATSQHRLYGRSSRAYKVLPCRLTAELLALYPTIRRRRRCSSPSRGASLC